MENTHRDSENKRQDFSVQLDSTRFVSHVDLERSKTLLSRMKAVLFKNMIVNV